MPKRLKTGRKRRVSKRTLRKNTKPKGSRKRRYRRRNMTGRGCPCQLGAQSKKQALPSVSAVIPGLQMGGDACTGAIPLSAPMQTGGDTFAIRSFYPLNDYNYDPNYYQVGERDIPQASTTPLLGGGVAVKKGRRRRKTPSLWAGGLPTPVQSGSGLLDPVTNAFSNFGSSMSNLLSDAGNGLSAAASSIPSPILGGTLSTNPVLSFGTVGGSSVSSNIVAGNPANNSLANQPLNNIYSDTNLPKA